MFWLPVFFAIFFHVSISGNELKTEKYCQIFISKNNHQPITLDSEGAFLYPDKNGTVRIEQKVTILIGCPGSKLPTGFEFENATCVSDTTFSIAGNYVNLSQINCDTKVKGIARYSNKSCVLNSKEIEIGYQLPNTFLKVIDVCFDNSNYIALYSHSNLSRFIGSHKSSKSPDFKQDNFYNIQSVNSLYNSENERKLVNQLLDLPENDTRYIQNETKLYFARGHLTPKGDFVYGYLQDLTFHLINAAPQWQIFNSGNWEMIEENVRQLAEKRQWDLSIYTGTFGVSTLPNSKSVDTPLYLYVKGSQKELPVPQYYWKIVIHEMSKTGVVIIGVNDPFLEDLSSYIICEDVASKLSWLKFKKDIRRGFIFACDVNEFEKIVPYIPQLDVTGLLI